MSRKEEIEARKVEIREEVDKAETTEQVEELEKEVDALNEESEQIAEQESNEKIADEMEQKSFEVKEIKKVEGKNMKEENKEFRNSKEYIEAYAEYIKEGLDKNYKMSEEARALITTNAEDGIVAVPDMVDNAVRTAWEREDIMPLVRTIYVKGNYKVQFEVSATDAVIHNEGDDPVTEEELVLGVVTLIPKSIKKWLSVSDEILDMKAEEFLNYIYDELTYRIAKKAADTLVAKIAALPQTLAANTDGIYDTPSAAKLPLAPSMSTVASGFANLSDDASDVTIIMNKLTHANFKAVALANGYAADPFDGFRVRYNNSLPAYDTASTGDVYMIVGDLFNGALVNYPNGSDITLKYDDKTLMTSDLVRILGRRFAAIEVVADKSFALISKPESV